MSTPKDVAIQRKTAPQEALIDNSGVLRSAQVATFSASATSDGACLVGRSQGQDLAVLDRA